MEEHDVLRRIDAHLERIDKRLGSIEQTHAVQAAQYNEVVMPAVAQTWVNKTKWENVKGAVIFLAVISTLLAIVSGTLVLINTVSAWGG